MLRAKPVNLTPSPLFAARVRSAGFASYAAGYDGRWTEMVRIISIVMFVVSVGCSAGKPRDEEQSLPPFIEAVEQRADGSFEVVVGAAINTPAKGEASSTDFRSLLNNAAMHLCTGSYEVASDNAIGLSQSRHGGLGGTMKGIVTCQ